ncbi:hypothetical protein C0584_05350 [Candidatus Parcubacteria bacterium]|nr:MAG: hypothetical protein C0584_05350 [Candidatus Parcubacteria bacterium]
MITQLLKKNQNSESANDFKESDIVGLKKYREINILLKKFPHSSKFQEEKEKTKEECRYIFDKSFKLNEKDWALLTLLRLFDRQTYEHSVGSFMIVWDKLENALEGGSEIKKGVQEEAGSLDVFYRACLFHDIGKITIPKFILRNSLTDKDWALKFYKSVKRQKNKIDFTTKKYLKKYNIFHFADKLAFAENPNEILSILKTKKIRPVQITPVRHGISKKEFRRLRKEYGIEEDVSLTEIMKTHEQESFNILYKLGYEKEAAIAGNHGDTYSALGGKKSKAYSSIIIGQRMSDIADLIYLADVQDALESDRYYHKSFTKLKILASLVNDVESGAVDENIARIWISDEFDKLKEDKSFHKIIEKVNKKLKNPDDSSRDVIEDMKKVGSFLGMF